MSVLEDESFVIRAVGVVTLAAVDLATREPEMFALEVGIIAVVARQAGQRYGLSKQARQFARVRFVAAAALILGRGVRNAFSDQSLYIFMAVEAEPRLLVEQQVPDFSRVRLMTSRAIARCYRVMLADGRLGNHIGVAFAAEFQRRFRQQSGVGGRVRSVTGRTCTLGKWRMYNSARGVGQRRLVATTAKRVGFGRQ